MGKHNDFGKLGEQKAVDFLINKGYEIKYRNYRYQKAEIDIIAQKGNDLAIIEVKSRTNSFTEDLTDAVNQKKIKLLVLAADHYILDNDLDVEARFDIITVLKKGQNFEVEHLKNAFYHF